MFKNLNAEESRHDENNTTMAKYLDITPTTYSEKKKTGKFTYSEIVKLLQKFDTTFEYLFAVKKGEE